jgi:hypothetical protein
MHGRNNIKLKKGSLYVFELNVTSNKLKIMSFVQQCFYSEFTSPAIVQGKLDLCLTVHHQCR